MTYLRFLFLIFVLLLPLGCRKQVVPESAAPTPGLHARTYVVEHLDGVVEFARDPAGPWSFLRSSDTLRGGFSVRTSYDAVAILRGNLGDRVILMELCRVILDPAFLRAHAGKGEDVRGLEVLSGKAWLDIAKGYGTFLGATPGGLVRVKGTRFSLAFDSSGARTRVVLTEGRVTVAHREKPESARDLAPGQAMEISAAEVLPEPTVPDSTDLLEPMASWEREEAMEDAAGGSPRDAVRSMRQDAREGAAGPESGASEAVAQDLEAMADSIRKEALSGSAGQDGNRPDRKLSDVGAGTGAGAGPGAGKDPLGDHEARRREAHVKMEARKAAHRQAVEEALEKTGGGAREDEAFEELERETGAE